MSESPSVALRRLFDEYSRGGVDAALGLIATDAVFDVTAGASAEPDTYEGHAGARRYFAGFEGAIDDVGFELVSAEDVGADRALAEVRLTGVGTTTRIPVEQVVAMVFSVRDGQVTRIAAYPELESARAALE